MKINGETWQQAAGNQVVQIHRKWKSGDIVELTLPMHIFRNTWQERSIAIERGPRTYGLKIGEEWLHASAYIGIPGSNPIKQMP